MNVLLTGSASTLSSVAFRALSASAHALVAVVVHQRKQQLLNNIIDAVTDDIELLAMRAGLPVIELHDTDLALKQMQQLHIDLIAVACYPKRLPEAFHQSLPCFNIHPSLLPRYRGPEPIFWQFRDAAEFGVSIHRVNAKLDAGEIVMQKHVQLPDGCDYAQAEHILAEQGATLLTQVIDAAFDDHLQPKPQNNALASYFPYPTAEDFVIDPGRSARSQYNFMCGTYVFGQPYRCRLSGREWYLLQALDFQPEASLGSDYDVHGDIVKIQCNPGVLIARQRAGIPEATDTL